MKTTAVTAMAVCVTMAAAAAAALILVMGGRNMPFNPTPSAMANNTVTAAELTEKKADDTAKSAKTEKADDTAKTEKKEIPAAKAAQSESEVKTVSNTAAAPAAKDNTADEVNEYGKHPGESGSCYYDNEVNEYGKHPGESGCCYYDNEAV